MNPWLLYNPKIFSAFGIPVHIHWTILPFFLLWGIADPEAFYIIAVCFASLIPHEYGHSLMARRYGINTRKIVITPVGGVALIEHLPKSAKKEMMITAAGPAVTLVLAIVFGALFLLNPTTFFGLTCFINLWLFLFNLLPMFPMDGGRFLRAFLNWRSQNYLWSTRMAVGIGQTIGFVLLFIGLITGSFGLAVTMLAVIYLGVQEKNMVERNESPPLTEEKDHNPNS